MDDMAFKGSAGLLLAKMADEEDEQSFEEWAASEDDEEDDSDSEVYAELGYSEQMENVSSLLTINIFSNGIMAGLIMGVIFWRKFT